MRALRDFNIPKIVTDDVPVFMGLISDLFPLLDVPRKRDMQFEKNIREAMLDQKLQPEENFILKVMRIFFLLKLYNVLQETTATGQIQVIFLIVYQTNMAHDIY